MSSESSTDSEFDVIESKSMVKKKKFKCKLGMLYKLHNYYEIICIILIDGCETEIKDIIKAKGNIKEIDELNLSKESLHTISLKLKKSIKAKDIDSIKSKDFKIINKHKETLQNLCEKVKFQNIKKDALKQFVKETCTIDEQGHIFKILMKLK